MCGIIAGFNYGSKKETINKWIELQLEDQIHRGKEGFGTVFIQKDRKVNTERSTEMIKALLDLRFNPTNMAILHHRTPTSSRNRIVQTHPIFVSNDLLEDDYLVVHNGVLHNEDELKAEHEELGFKYTTEKDLTETTKEFNDSEALAIEASRFIEGQTKKIGSIGSVAFIAIQIEKKTGKAKRIFFARNSNPLHMSKTKGKLRLSSEGEGEDIKENTLYSCNLIDFKLKKKKCIIDQYKSVSLSTPAERGMGYQTDWPTAWDRRKQEEEEFMNYNDIPHENIKDLSPVHEATEDLEIECTQIISECIDDITAEMYTAGAQVAERDIELILEQALDTIKTEIESKLPKLGQLIMQEFLTEDYEETNDKKVVTTGISK